MSSPALERTEIYLRAASTVPSEVDVELRVAEGALPPDLRGAFYRNGPGTNESWGVRYRHPFDGDGHVVRFGFDGARVRYRNRFVATRERAREAEARKPLFRSFGTNLPGGLRANALRLAFKNAANTSVVWHGDKLLALWEGGLPHRLDPVTLETLGRDDYDGRLRNKGSRVDRMMAPELPFSAHPKIDPETGEMFNFGALLGPKPALLLHRVSAAGRLDEPEHMPLDRLMFLHDFALTPRWRVFFLVPVAFRVARTLLGLTSLADGIESLDEPTRILLVPRGGGEPVAIETSSCFVFHFVNAHEEADGRVVVTALRLPAFPSSEEMRALYEGHGGKDFPVPVPTLYTIDPVRGTVQEERLSNTPAELATIDSRRVGKPNRYFWALAGERGTDDPFLKRILRFDLETRREVVRDFAPDLPTEPMFVPSGDGEEGWVLTLVYRASEHRSDLYVLRADDLSTVCRLELPHHVPPGFHGAWVPAPVPPVN